MVLRAAPCCGTMNIFVFVCHSSAEAVRDLHENAGRQTLKLLKAAMATPSIARGRCYRNVHESVGLGTLFSPVSIDLVCMLPFTLIRSHWISIGRLDRNRFTLHVGTRKDIYNKLKEFSIKINTLRDSELKRFIQKILDGYRRMGIELNDNKQHLLKKIKDKITTTERELDISIDMCNDYITLSIKELKGLPEQFIKKLPYDKHKYNVVLQQSIYEMCM